MVTVVNTWTNSYARDPIVYKTNAAPPITPLATAVSNTAGNWLFALVSWRQDAGTAGTLPFPSTVSVSDDAANFWIPVYSGTAASAPTNSPVTGIVRCAVWMAPAARQAEFVFSSPTAYQSAVTVVVIEVTAASPWYQVQLVDGTFTNQGGSISLSDTIPNGVFALGMIAWDNISGSVTATATGWTGISSSTATNATDHSGDLRQFNWFITGTGASQTISATGTPTMDWASIIVVVSGVSDTRAFPYTPALENWPVIVTEIASGPVLNADPVFANGTASWSATNASLTSAAGTWPLWAPAEPYQPDLYGSVLVTPSGTATSANPTNVLSGRYATNATQPYTALAWVMSPGGWGVSGNDYATVFINWYTSGAAYISTSISATTVLAPGEWTQLSISTPVFPPPNAAFGQVGVQEVPASGATVPPSAVYYVAYCAFSIADSYEGNAPDQLAWYDISGRVFTQGSVSVSRGIQYEQQSLEAGTMTLYLANNDGQETFGNVLSPLWPNVGDTDVPIRVRMLWPGSVTPYTVLFSGYTDQVRYGVDQGSYYGYAEVTASDAWSRMTQQMLAAVEEEQLLDNPILYAPCNNSGTNIAVSAFSSQPMMAAAGPGGSGVATQSFSGTGASPPGSAGLSCWASANTQAAGATGNFGWALTWFTQTTLHASAPGITIEFWFNPVSVSASQPTGVNVVCACWTGSGPQWVLWIDNNSTAAATYLWLTTYANGTGTGTPTRVSTNIQFLNGTTTSVYFCSVTFTTTSITVTINPSGTPTETLTLGGQTFARRVTGFSFGGMTGPSASVVIAAGTGVTTSSYGFCDMAIFGVTIYAFPGVLPPAARVADHFQAGEGAFASESDNWRLARIAGYAGFIPVLGMRGLDLPGAPHADEDIVTGATDTNTQVASAYFTNVAQSTLAALFVNGAGTVIYRRRAEWYNRPLGQWVAGGNDNQLLSLGFNPLNSSASTSGWSPGSGATLATSSQPAAGPLFSPFCGVFHGDGVTSGAFILTSSQPATAGNFYQFTVWVYSPQGWATGVQANMQFFTSGFAFISQASSVVTPLAAGQLGYMTTGPVRAPNNAAFAAIGVSVSGTPPAGTLFYVAAAQAAQITPDYAGGAGVAVPEAPYMPSVTSSSDRAQLFNYAVITQYGQNLISSFSGTGVLFTPSSGVIVIVSNQPSISLRGQVPYTATIYLDNTVQALPYYLNEGSLEDVGNWVTQTLGSPLFRPDSVMFTPAATPAALQFGLLAEVGDTVTFRRRPFGSPPVEILTFISKISHSINIAAGQWTVTCELSPFPQGAILTCDDVVHGVLTGQNNLGW